MRKLSVGLSDLLLLVVCSPFILFFWLVDNVFSGWPGRFNKISWKNKAKKMENAEEAMMRSERTRSLAVSPDGASYIKDLARYFRNVPEKNRKAVLLGASKKSDSPS